MNKQLFLLIILIATLSLSVFCKDSPQKWQKYRQPSNLSFSNTTRLYQQKQYYFQQIIDHSNYQQTKYYKQRYWVVNDYFNPSSGPVYLFICGQYICPGVPPARQWIVTLAQRTLGLILVVQHRFYGQSLPFGNDTFKLENMKLLTSEQALSDLAYFVQQVSVNSMFGVKNNPWICVGGSYPGAMSAWFRYKYPHLVIGAIASSAVVQSVQNFPEFDQQMFLSANKSSLSCANAINNSNIMVQSILNSSKNQQFKSQFTGGINLKDDQFMFFWIDSIVSIIQYGGRSKMCKDLQGKSQNEQFDYFVKNAKNSQVYEYGSYYIKNQTFALENGHGQRSWYYQSCTQFGYWQTPSLIHPLRSKLLSIDFYKRFCADSFGEGTWPKVDRKNTQTGGWNLQASNLLMSNGDQDPWKWASVMKSRDNIISRVANCTDCAHCVDLYTPNINDSSQLKKIRDEQFITIQQWIADYWRDNKVAQIEKIINKQSKINENKIIIEIVQ